MQEAERNPERLPAGAVTLVKVLKVWKWPKLSGEACKCWHDLLAAAGYRYAVSIRVSLAELAATQKRSESAARRWLDSLEKAGLAEVVKHGDGTIDVRLPNPAGLTPPDEAPRVCPRAREHPRPLLENLEPPDRPALSVVAGPEVSDPASEPLSDPLSEPKSDPIGAGTGNPSVPFSEPFSEPKSEPAPGKGKGPTRARARSTSTDDDDVDNWSTSTSTDDQKEIPDEDEPARWLEAVEEAYRLIGRYPKLRARSQDPRNRSLFLKACYLARTEFSEDWLIDSLEAVARMRPREGKAPNPWAYLHACLAEKAGMSGEDFNRLLAPITLTLADELITMRRVLGPEPS